MCIFGLKLSLRLKIVLSSITTFKRYCKATLNVFKIKFIMTKNFIYMVDISCKKLFKILDFIFKIFKI